MPDPDQPFIVVGDRVALGELREDLIPAYGRWVNSLEVRFGLGHLGVASTKSETKWFQDMVEASAEREPRAAAFTVYDRSDAAPVGTASLFSISYLHRTALFGIAIGERRGQGLGTDATRLILDWAFNVLGLHNVLLEAVAWNEAAIRAYTKAGFRTLGRRRQGVMNRGRRWDVVYMDAVATDFHDSVLV